MDIRKGWCEVVTVLSSRKTIDFSKSSKNMAQKTGHSSHKNCQSEPPSKEQENNAVKG